MLKILHFEKSTLLRKMMGDAFFGNQDIEYIPVTKVEKAYSIIKSDKLDLIITSLVMKDEDIENFIKVINLSDNKNTNIFVVSGDDFDIKKGKLLDMGVSEYIKKDFMVEEIREYIDALFIEEKLEKVLKANKIAIIDDSSFDRQVVGDILSKNGITNIDNYSSGKALFSVDTKYDIYVVDIVLKDEYGKDIIKKIRRKNKNAIIFVCTSLLNTKTISSILNAGADDYMSKPIDENILLAKLKARMRPYISLRSEDE